MTSAGGRVAKDIGAICKPDSSGVIAICAADDTRVPSNPGWRHLVGTITGPEGTPYEGGVFDVDILIPREYPFEPPRMKFITRIWHPNISSQTGAIICLVSWDVNDDDLMAFRMSDAVGFLATIGSEEYFCSESQWNK
jgi:ubiquitin-protein ligase